MLKSYRHSFFLSPILLSLLTYFFFTPLRSLADSGNDSPLSFKGSDKKIIKQYLKIHRKFVRASCPSNMESRFHRLRKEFTNNEFHIPVLLDGKFDKDTVRYYLPEIEKKQDWIKSVIVKLRTTKNFNKITTRIKQIRKVIKSLLGLKESFENGKKRKNGTSKSKILSTSGKQLEKLRQLYGELMSEAPFFQSYNYPVDHLKLRKSFDQAKMENNDSSKKRANGIFFFRKIVEDGVLNRRQTGNDIIFRSNLDNIHFSLRKNSPLIFENLRYDLVDALVNIEQRLKKGKVKLIADLIDWEKRISRSLNFYHELLSNNDTVSKLISTKSTSRQSLKNFVLSNQAKVYKYWSGESELNRALFVIETILINEVGTLDNPGALERKDIVQVILNRFNDPFYSGLTDKDSIYPYLKRNGLTDEKIEAHRWLNLFFKEGEFSFSYYFIPSTVRIFCPSQVKRIKRLREANLKIALMLLKEPNWNLKAIRYFSRISMIGRVDMKLVWKNLIEIPQKLGYPIKRAKHLLDLYNRGNYSYLYRFFDKSGNPLKVVKINDKTFVVEDSNKNSTLYSYRSPHIFTYFKTPDS